MKLPPDFRDLLAEFARAGVEHVIVGGYAFAYHAEPRATKDLDLLIEGSAANRERAAQALAQFGAPVHVVEAVRTLREDEVAYVGEPPLRVDILREVDGIAAGVVLRNAVTTTWDDLEVRVIGLDDLITNKRAAGRARDLADLERLLVVRGESGH